VKRVQVQVLASVDITGYGRVGEGAQDLPEDLAQLLVERGLAVPVPAGDSAPEGAGPGDSAKKKK
jgi:hypothetical protein